MITPGPVVITVAFIGYLVAGPPARRWPPSASFCPATCSSSSPAPYFRALRGQSAAEGVRGRSDGGGDGAIAGAAFVLGTRAIIDLPDRADRSRDTGRPAED